MPQPAMRIGARIVLITSVSTCTTIVGFTMPVPRSAEPIATIANCNAMPGRNQYRYVTPAWTVASSAAIDLTYASEPV